MLNPKPGRTGSIRWSFGFDLREGKAPDDAPTRLKFAPVPGLVDFLTIDPAFWPRLEGVEEYLIEAPDWNGSFYFSSIEKVGEWLALKRPQTNATIIRIDYWGSQTLARRNKFFDFLIHPDARGRSLGFDVVDWSLWSVFNTGIIGQGLQDGSIKTDSFNRYGLFHSCREAAAFARYADNTGPYEHFPVEIIKIGLWMEGKVWLI